MRVREREEREGERERKWDEKNSREICDDYEKFEADDDSICNIKIHLTHVRTVHANEYTITDTYTETHTSAHTQSITN